MIILFITLNISLLLLFSKNVDNGKNNDNNNDIK